MSDTSKPLRGRPPKPVAERRRNNQVVRLRDATFAQVKHSAENNQRSISEELESRVEQSFLSGDILEKLFGGPKTLQVFLKTAMWLRTESFDELKCNGDDWIDRADGGFIDRLADQLVEWTIWEHATSESPVAELKVDPSKREMPEVVRFATPEELADFKPVVAKRADRLRSARDGDTEPVMEVERDPARPPELFDVSDFTGIAHEDVGNSDEAEPVAAPKKRRKAKARV